MGRHSKAEIFSPAQLRALQQMYHTDAAIAKRCDVTRQAIQQLRMKWGVSAKCKKRVKVK